LASEDSAARARAASAESPANVAVGRGERADLTESLRQARADLADLAGTHERLLEAQETLRAIRQGEVDAVVVQAGAPGAQVFTLSSADRPYRIFVETMQEGAATVSAAGIVLYANGRLGDLLGCSTSRIVARPMNAFVTRPGRPGLSAAIDSAVLGATIELDLTGPDGRAVTVQVGISRLDVDEERLTCLTFTDLTAEHNLLREVQASQQRFRALYKGAPVPAFTWQNADAGLVLIDYNVAAEVLTAGAVAAANGHCATAYYRDAPDMLAALRRCLAEQEVVDLESVSPGPGGGLQHLNVTMVPVPPDLVVVHTQDVTEGWVAEQALRSSEESYRTIVENAHEGISLLDDTGLFTFANPRTAELLGRDTGTLVGMDAARFLGSAVTRPAGTQQAPGPAQFEVTATRLDGRTIELLVSTAPVIQPDSGQAGSLCMISDVSGLRHAEEELAHQALHDALTGLPNRNLLMDRIDQALARGRRGGEVAALFCDLDGFKEVNDTFGHHIGDEVLQAVAIRLRAAVRPADTVARIGGDEFVILCDQFLDKPAAFGLAARVLAMVAEPLEVSGHQIPLSLSIGVAFAASADPGELLRDADAAMYLAKQRGRNRMELFDEGLRQVASDRLGVIADLRQAVTRGEMRVHYQPVFSLLSGAMLGVEALIRWQHPRRGLLLPDTFVSIAENAGLIGDIGSWVLKRACHQAARWDSASATGGPLHMSVNVSARQLAKGSDLVSLVSEALHEASIDPATLVLEVTESVLMDDAEAALTILTELKGLGVQLAIDDFGTGYSSLVYLKRFPIDQLKIDRSFVRGLDSDADDSAIVASVVGLAHAVGIVAIAEGVETEQQLAALKRLGCGFGQGYLWSHARSATDLNAFVRSTRAVAPVPS